MAAVAMTFSAAALAGDHAKMRIEIAGDGGETHFNLDSDALGFDLHAMQVGESQSVVDESGRSILITRKEHGLTLETEGKSFDVPLYEDAHTMAWMGSDFAGEVDVDVIHDVDFAVAGVGDGVTIISRVPIDAVTRESIKSLLASTGHSGDVEFIDTSVHAGGDRQVRVIKKQIHIEQ